MIRYLNLDKKNNNNIKEFKKWVKENSDTLGENTGIFEREFSTVLGDDFVAGVANGTVALEIVMRSLSLPAYSEIFVPTNSFLKANLQVELEEVNPNNSSLSVGLIEYVITSETCINVQLQLFEQCAPVREIYVYTKNMNPLAVEDFVQAQSVMVRNINAGRWAKTNIRDFVQMLATIMLISCSNIFLFRFSHTNLNFESATLSSQTEEHNSAFCIEVLSLSIPVRN